MNKLKPQFIVWLFPFAYLIHLLDEFYLGGGFAKWYSSLLNANLSEYDFLVINSIAIVLVITVAILYSLGKINNFIPAVLGILFFMNGFVHLMLSVVTWIYSPGTISGIIIYIPLGVIVYKNIFPLLTQDQRTSSIIAAIALHILISVIAFAM
ncbi:MAG: HXXEE domain-containing protein [Ignavibacteria bacterium]|jgi:hypothetical protein